MTSRRLLSLGVLTCALVLCADPAHAQSHEKSGADAVAAGNEAVALYDSGKFSEALTRFREANALYHSPVFVLYEARCLKGGGDVDGARATYRRLLDEPIPPDAPPVWRQAKADASAELAALDARLGPEGAPTAAIPPTAVEPLSAMRAPATAPVASTQPPPDDSHPHGRAVSLPGVVLMVTGGAALVAGSIVGIVALNKEASVRQSLPASCLGDRQGGTVTCLRSDQAEIESRQKPLERLGRTADALFIAGGVTATLGLALFVLTPTKESKLSAAVAPNHAELRLDF